MHLFKIYPAKRILHVMRLNGLLICIIELSFSTGAQCNMETVENIVWARTPAITNATVPCPGQEENRDRNETYGNTLNNTLLMTSTLNGFKLLEPDIIN
jgi:hypothetical protein